jgi:hypothetical protein
MDNGAAGEFSRTGYGGLSDGDKADGVALVLNYASALSDDCRGHAPAVLKARVCGVYDGIDIARGDVALYEPQGFSGCLFFIDYLH